MLVTLTNRHCPRPSRNELPFHFCRTRPILRPDHSAVFPSGRSPTVIEVGWPFRERKFRRQLLVNLHAESWFFLREHITVLDFGAALEDLLRVLRETGAFVNTEVIAGEFERQLRRVRHGRSVARAVPSGANAEVFAQSRDLASRTQTADLRDVDADEINQPVFDQR